MKFVAIFLATPSLFFASFFIPARYEIVKDLGILVLIEDKIDTVTPDYQRPYLFCTFIDPDTGARAVMNTLNAEFHDPVIGERYAMFRALNLWGLTIAGRERHIVLPYE